MAKNINDPCYGKIGLNACAQIVIPYKSAQSAQTNRDNTFLFKGFFRWKEVSFLQKSSLVGKCPTWLAYVDLTCLSETTTINIIDEPHIGL